MPFDYLDQAANSSRSFHDRVCIGLADQDEGLKNLGIAIAVDCLVRIIDTQTLEQAACALRDLVQLLAPLRWGYAPWSLSIQPEPQGRRFELSFEIRDGPDRNADRSGDLLKIRVPVPSDFRWIRNHWNPTHRDQRTARFSLSITELKGISFHRRKHEEARANTREANPNFDRVNIQTFSTVSARSGH